MGTQCGPIKRGAVSNEGVEIDIQYNGKVGERFNFSIAPNFTYIKIQLKN